MQHQGIWILSEDLIILQHTSFLDATSYAHHVFKAFDVSSTGSISFRVSLKIIVPLHQSSMLLQDMLVTLSTLLHGTLYEKLVWTFRLYDLDCDGHITKTELGNVVVAVYQLMGIEFTVKVRMVCN